jgi:hypothetical protein
MKTTYQVQISIFFGFIFLICSSCEHEYNYLSEKDKQYLLYDLGDTIMFQSENDTIYGLVHEKHFWTTSNGIFGTEHFEKGTVHIRSLNDTENKIANIDVGIFDDKVMYDISIFIENSDSSLDYCLNPIIPFNALLINGELFQYSDNKSSVKMEPVISDIYEFNYVQEYCPDELKSTLHLSISKGFTILIINNSDSITISEK